MKKINVSRLQKTFVALIKEYMKKRNLNQGQMAKMVGIQRPHLNALLNFSPERPLTAYYLWRFLRRGILSVSQIKDDKVESERELEFWETASEAENLDFLRRIAVLRKKQVDLDKWLDLLESQVSASNQK